LGASGIGAAPEFSVPDFSVPEFSVPDIQAADGGAAVGAAAPGVPRVRARREPWRAVFFGLVAVAILAGAAWAVLGSSLLVVRHVEVTGGDTVPAASIREAAAIRRDTPMARLDASAVARRVEQITLVASASVHRSWPDTVVISVRYRVAALAVADGTQFQLVDVDGVTLRQVTHRPAGMPVLTGPPAVLRGSPAVHAAVTVLGQLPANVRRRVRSVAATPGGDVTLRLTRGVTVVWGGTGQATQKAAELTVLMRTHSRYYDVSDPATAVTQG
jgi:cell division protein FtsQ